MDLSKELNEIILDKKSPCNVVSDLLYEQEQIKKKIHIFKVLTIATELEDRINEGFFVKHGISSLRLVYSNNYAGSGSSLYVTICDNKGKVINENSYYDTKIYSEPLKFIQSIFNPMEDLNNQFINSSFSEKEVKRFQLEPGVGKEILTLLLSDEFKKNLEYNKMNVLLPQKEESINKRPKI
jgi:hypothetical protein